MTTPIPGYAAAATPDTIVVVASDYIKSIRFKDDTSRFLRLKAAIGAEKSLAEIKDIIGTA